MKNALKFALVLSMVALPSVATAGDGDKPDSRRKPQVVAKLKQARAEKAQHDKQQRARAVAARFRRTSDLDKDGKLDANELKLMKQRRVELKMRAQVRAEKAEKKVKQDG